MQNLCGEDFYINTPYNAVTKTQIWLSQIGDSHDNFCYCETPYAHLLASIFPPGHQDRNRTIEEILQRDYKEKCRSGGAEGENSGGIIKEEIKDADHTEEEERDSPGDKELDELLIAAANAVEGTR